MTNGRFGCTFDIGFNDIRTNRGLHLREARFVGNALLGCRLDNARQR
jgi:hypothetical protein